MYILKIFYILKGANLPLVFKLREICSVDAEENLPPDVRF